MSMIMRLKQLPHEELADLEKDRAKVEKIMAAVAASQTQEIRELYRKLGITSMEVLLEKHPHMQQIDPEIRSQMEKMLFAKPRKSRKGPPVLSLEKSWHVIHYLLSGEVWTGDLPLGKTLMGGKDFGDESFNTGYGNPRYHDPESVKQISESLPAISELQSKYDPAKIADAGIYGFNKDDPDEEWEYLSHFYLQMVDYFHDAAKRGNGMILLVA